MNKDSKTLTKIFNMADESGLYCSMTIAGGEVLSIFVGEETFLIVIVVTITYTFVVVVDILMKI